MMRYVAVLCAVTLAGVAYAGDLPPLNPKNGTIISASHARDLLSQCSRGTPQNVQGVWQPNADQIRDLEARLPGALQQEMTKRGHTELTGSSPPIEFGRQYAGLVIGARKIVYVNAFPLEVMSEANDWRASPVMVCDGGEAFFGVEYDPQTKTFAHFEFNGFA